jgi:hypothetical protein
LYVCVHTHTHTHTWTQARAHTLACTLLCISRLCKLGLVNGSECDRCKQASETALYGLCDCKALDFMHSGDLEAIRFFFFSLSISPSPGYFTLFKSIKFGQSAWVCIVSALLVFFYSILFCSMLFYTCYQSKVQSNDNRMWHN